MADSRSCSSNDKSQDENHHLFCFFKGSTKGLIEVGQIDKLTDANIYTIHLPNVFLTKTYMLEMGDYIQLDGVLCQVIKAEHEVTNDNDKYKWNIVVSTTFELVEGTTLKDLKAGCKVSLGIMAVKEEEATFLIHPSTSKQAKCTHVEETYGSHGQAVVRFDFSCAAGDIIPDRHVGINGSAFYVKSAKDIEGLLNFIIFVGKQAQANTRFNKNELKVEELVNINVSKNDSPPDEVYPNKHMSLSKT